MVFDKSRFLGVVGVVVFLTSISLRAESDISIVLNNQVTPSSITLAGQPGTLGGEAGLACEVLLCLAAVGVAPTACKSPLKKFFSLKPKRRPGFLAKCPKVSG